MVLVTANRYIDECHPTVPDSLAIYSGVPQFQYFPELIYGTKEVLYLHCQLYYKDTHRCALRAPYNRYQIHSGMLRPPTVSNRQAVYSGLPRGPQFQ